MIKDDAGKGDRDRVYFYTRRSEKKSLIISKKYETNNHYSFTEKGPSR